MSLPKPSEEGRFGMARHTPEDLQFLREQKFTETADEIERLHMIEDALRMVAKKIAPGDANGETFADFSMTETDQIFTALQRK